MSKLLDYNTPTQKFFLEMMLHDAENYVRVQNIFNPENFAYEIRKAAEFIHKHAEKHSILPDRKQIDAMTGVALDELPDNIDAGHNEWFLENFESFTKQKELERAIGKAAELLDEGDFGPVEKIIKDAVQISLTTDMGLDYFDNPRARLEAIKDNNGQNSTGWQTLDRKLYGGFNRGELQVFAGGSGSGKSLFMQNLSINWLEQGLDGIFLTLELSEELCAWRMDSMLTDTPSKQVFKDLDNIEIKVKMKAKTHGSLRIKYMPAQSNVNDIRVYIRELAIQHNMKPAFICIDYLDLLMPATAKVSPNDLFVKDKYVSEELRNLAKEFNIIMVTASQLNRSAVEEIEFDHSHISGGISKINTADNVFGIFTSLAMRERGKYQIQLMKTRSSSGVGAKIDLDFDRDTLRITDPGLPDDSGTTPPPPTAASAGIMDQIKPKSTITDEPKVRAEVDGSKLKRMLNNLNKDPAG